ncbi:hotdog domain-containing protein [Nocardioides daejeonensis]|uniref:3-aminobutyryl-CoA ammonia lyase n=1 Tax=Nocardioides daejeonensis TaxID=1046556 RepID=UPI000D74AFD9|nr:hotdog domain-containing protein [Nocardioides daejeonensis]
MTVGTRVVHRSYVSFDHAHYAGNLVDGAFSLARFGDAATDLCILTDGDEGLFAGYDEVRFLAPVQAGDVLEIEAELVGAGTRSRRMRFTATVVARGRPRAGRPGAAEPLQPPILATTATGTVVVPAVPDTPESGP